MGKHYNTPITQEEELLYTDDDWRGWSDITEEEIEIARNNGIDRYLLYQRIENTFMPISRAIRQPKRMNEGTVITKEQSEILHKEGIPHHDAYRQIKLYNKTFEETLEYYRQKREFLRYRNIAIQNEIPLRTFYTRVNRGWDLKRASSEKRSRQYSYVMTREQLDFIKRNELPRSTIYAKMKKGMSFEEAVEFCNSTRRERKLREILKQNNITQEQYALLKRMGLSDKQIFKKGVKASES